MLSALASSMMTVTALTFSITMVALTLASQQFTPRVLRHFAANPGTKSVLGTFIGTFIYCLLVLRTIRAGVADTTHELIDHLFPEPLGHEATPEEARAEGVPEELGEGIVIPACDGGYLQAVDLEALMTLASEEDLLVRMERDVGDFVPREGVPVSTTSGRSSAIWPSGRSRPGSAKMQAGGCG